MSSEIQTSNLLMLGLPRTGKSTFIAALWHVLESGELENSLALDQFEGNREYVNSLQTSWLEFKQLERTVLTEGFTAVKLPLRIPGKGKGALLIPDLSGEEYQNIWLNRSCPLYLAEFVSVAQGILLFIHPGTVTEPQALAKVNAVVEEFADDVELGPDAEEERLPEWDLQKSPTQVALVELLQFLTQDLGVAIPTKVAVIISAWDTVTKNEEISPQSWLAKYLPLLAQFLDANSDSFEREVFGISAQGGVLPDDKEQLMKCVTASERIRVSFRGQKSNDITLPIRWAMGHEG